MVNKHDKTPTKRELQRIETRKKVFNAAVDEFKRVGVAEAQIENIVNKAEVSVGTYYKNFPTKDDVLRELQQHYVHRIGEAFLNKAQGNNLNLKDTLLAAVDPIFDLFDVAEFILTREILSLIVRQQTSKNFGWEDHPLMSYIIAAFQKEQDEGSLIDGDPVERVKMFFTAILGFFAGHDPEQNHQQAKQFIDVFLRGISAST